MCPECKKKGERSHPNDRSLSVNLSTGEWLCHYCGWKGRLENASNYQPKERKTYRKPVPRPVTELSRKLVSWFNGRGISERTLSELKVSEGEHFFPQINCKRNAILFNYYLNGELINVKYRDGQKNFTLEAGAELIPYNIDAISDTTECIITEGEIDCMSFVEIGHKNCVSVPNGAGTNLSYLDDFMEGWFDNMETIYIASDTDGRGLELRAELIRRFGPERCKIITYGDCKDANDHLKKYGKESLEKCFAKAADIKVDGVFTISDYESELDEIYKNGLQRGLTVGIPNFDELISFETKRLCIVTGCPGAGKSEVIDQLVVNLNVRYDFRAAYFSPENMPLQLHAIKLIEKLTGKKFQQYEPHGMSLPLGEYTMAKEYLSENFFHILPEEGYTIDRILDKAKYLVRKKGIRVLVLDPFTA